MLTLLLAACPMLLADPLASGYAVYADSLVAGAGSDIPVRFYLANEQPIASVSVPLAYDPSRVTLKSISFTGSRAQHIVNKIVTPSDLPSANGRFLVAVFQWLEVYADVVGFPRCFDSHSSRGIAENRCVLDCA